MLGGAPYGWKWRGPHRGKKLVEDRDEQAVIRLVFNMRELEGSMRQIAERLTHLRVKRRDGRTGWNQVVVHGIINRGLPPRPAGAPEVDPPVGGQSWELKRELARAKF